MSHVLLEAEYGPDLARKAAEWIEKQTMDDQGGCKVFRPYALITLYDQNGEPVK